MGSRSEQDRPKRARLGTLRRVTSAFAGLVLSAAGGGGAEPPPWDFANGLEDLPALRWDHQSLLRSSRCPSGCRFDRHSPLGPGGRSPRFLRMSGSEMVIFEDLGPGAVTRIWMTTGDGTSRPLPREVTIRIYVDGELAVAAPLPGLFDGSLGKPFTRAVSFDRTSSSGGNVTYVPMPYRRKATITLTGAEDVTLWYQVHYAKTASPDGVTAFDPSRAPEARRLADLVSLTGSDPWGADAGRWRRGNAALSPGEPSVLLDENGAGTITGLRIELPPKAWPDVDLRVSFDGETSIAPLSHYFALGARTLLVGRSRSGKLYSYLPMPFRTRARIELVSRSGGGIAAPYQVRLRRRPPPSDHGVLMFERTDEAAFGELDVLRAGGSGKWVGWVALMQSIGTRVRDYLEGDEQIFVDGSRHPAQYGTGTEDIFAGGFYFDDGTFEKPLHGNPTHLPEAEFDLTVAYRFFLADAVSWRRSIRADLEAGPTGNRSMRGDFLVYYYAAPRSLRGYGVLRIGNAASEAKRAYRVEGDFERRALTARWEELLRGKQTSAEGVYFRRTSTESFTFGNRKRARGFLLRRRYDAARYEPGAEVYVNGARVGAFPPQDANPTYRWREQDLLFRLDNAPASLEFEIRPLPGPGDFSSFRYQLMRVSDSS